MKVLHTIDSMHPGCGGTTTCTAALVNGLRSAGICTDILTRSERDPGFSSMRISTRLRRELRGKRADIYHTHGLWMDVNHATCTHARRHQKPCVISPHGMLYPEALQRHEMMKSLMMKLFQLRDLEQAACIHVTSEQEMHHVQKILPRSRIGIIPLPVAEPPQEPEATPHRTFRVGYLGRLHPIKNIENLIRAWGLLQLPEAELVVMGDGPQPYRESLQRLAVQIGGSITFTGFLSGQAKYDALASLDVFCAPSHQENFGMSIAEALRCGTPVLASRHTPWQCLNDLHCGSWQGNSSAELAEGLLAYYRLSVDERRQMGKRGKEFIRRQFSPASIARSMLRLYQYLLGDTAKPDFVHE